jgi:hypothetical protein
MIPNIYHRGVQGETNWGQFFGLNQYGDGTLPVLWSILLDVLSLKADILLDKPPEKFESEF